LFFGKSTPAIRAKVFPPLYPCLCLCRLFSQITLTTPFLRTILHLLHIFFMDGLTFMFFTLPY